MTETKIDCHRCLEELAKISKGISTLTVAPPKKHGGMVGWTCPNCGCGCSPFTNYCQCVPMDNIVMRGT